MSMSDNFRLSNNLIGASFCKHFGILIIVNAAINVLSTKFLTRRFKHLLHISISNSKLIVI